MRRVVYFTDSDGFGGAERVLLTLLAQLDTTRWEPVLAHTGSSAIQPLIDGANALEIPHWPVEPLPEGVAGAGRVPDLARALRGRGVDVFHAQLTWPLACKYPLAAALLGRVPAVLATVHSYPSFTMTRATELQQRALGSRVGRYIAVSDDLRSRLLARMPWPPERLSVVHNGIDVDAPAPAADPRLRAAISGGSELPVVLAASRLDRGKGLDVLIDTAAKVAGACFAIAGEGPQRRALSRRIAELGLEGRVRLLGWREDLRELLAASDVFVQPSRNEGLSIAVLEAMAVGCPVVATDAGGTRESIEDGVTGVLVPPGDAGALAAALTAALEDPARRAAFGAAGAARVRASFSAAAMTTGTTAIYDELLTGA